MRRAGFSTKRLHFSLGIGFPLPGGRTQYNLGCLLFWEAEASKASRDAEERLVAAIQAFNNARTAHQHVQSSQDWVAITLGLANARLSLGTRLCLPEFAPNRGEGLKEIHQAMMLYKQAIPQLASTQLKVGLANVRIAFEIFAKISSSEEERAGLRGHIADVIALRVRHYSRYNHGDERILNRLSALANNLPLIDTVPEKMYQGSEKVISDILGILASSGLPKTEWPAILRTALEQIASPARSLPDEMAAHAETAEGAREVTSRAKGKVRSEPEPTSSLLTPKVQAIFGKIPKEFRTRSYIKQDENFRGVL